MESMRLDAAMNWLQEAAADLPPAENLEGVLEEYLSRLLDWLGAAQGSIMLKRDDKLVMMIARGLGAEVRQGMRIGLQEGPAGMAAMEGTPRLISGPLPSRRTEHPPASALIIPIRARDQVVGVLNVGRTSEASPFTPEDLETGSVLATQVAWILAKSELMARMWTLVVTDELSGLYNRRYFRMRLQEEILRSRRYDEPVCVTMIDLDGFKELNSRHGHLIGDEVLAQVCAVIRGNIRTVDIASRYGGDEISIILPGTSASSAQTTVDRLRCAVASEVFVGDKGAPVKLTLCAGIAEFPTDATEPEALIRKADLALLEAKRTGGGRVLVAG